jgi:hypothetical protein
MGINFFSVTRPPAARAPEQHEDEAPENLNTGEPWSEMDLFDLGNCVRLEQPVAEIADFLCRSQREVQDKISELRRRHELDLWIERSRPGTQD